MSNNKKTNDSSCTANIKILLPIEGYPENAEYEEGGITLDPIFANLPLNMEEKYFRTLKYRVNVINDNKEETIVKERTYCKIDRTIKICLPTVMLKEIVPDLNGAAVIDEQAIGKVVSLLTDHITDGVFFEEVLDYIVSEGSGIISVFSLLKEYAARKGGIALLE